MVTVFLAKLQSTIRISTRKSACLIIAASICYLPLLAGQATAQGYEQELEQLSVKLAERISKTGAKKVAVANFCNLRDELSELGVILAEEMTNALVNADSGLSVIDRRNLNIILNEHKLSQSGLIDARNAKKLGRISEIDAYILGTVHLKSNSLRVIARAYSTETGQIIASASRSIPATNDVKKATQSHLGSCAAEKTIAGTSGDTKPTEGCGNGPAWLGTKKSREVTRDMADALGMKRPHGVLITRIIKNSPAKKAGIRRRDIIVAIDGQDIGSYRDFTNSIDGMHACQSAEFTVIRDGRKKKLNVRLGSRPVVECDGQKTHFFCARVLYAQSSRDHAVVGVELKNISGVAYNVKGNTNGFGNMISSLIVNGRKCVVRENEDVTGLPSYNGSPHYFGADDTITVTHSFYCNGRIAEGTAVLSTQFLIYPFDENGRSQGKVSATISPPPFQISPR